MKSWKNAVPFFHSQKAETHEKEFHNLHDGKNFHHVYILTTQPKSNPPILLTSGVDSGIPPPQQVLHTGWYHKQQPTNW